LIIKHLKTKKYPMLRYTLLVGIGLLTTCQLLAQSITPTNGPFVQGDVLRFAYSGGTGAATDWIGIYKHGQTPGSVGSTVWQYIGAPSGEVEFAGTLDTGRYDVRLFCCDGYNTLASYLDFYVAASRIRSRLSIYKSTDSLRLTAQDVVAGDRVVLVAASDVSSGSVAAGATFLAQTTLPASAMGVAVTLAPMTASVPLAAALLAPDGSTRGVDFLEIKNAPTWPATVTRLGFGSCANQNSAQTTLRHALGRGIEGFIWLGDNAYIDTYSLPALRAEYERWLTLRTEMQDLRASVPMVATWDDHDYGCCDEDADYPLKAQSQQILLDFFEEPANSPRRSQEGIYTQYLLGPNGQRLQIILLDSRYWLDDKRPNNGCGTNDYCAWAGPADANKTMLGAAQWQWLREALLQPADLRIVGSSVQFSSSYHGFEGWSLFPYERRRMQDLIKETQAERVVFLSGDMHYAEVSRLHDVADVYPLYDFTSSGINQSWPPEPNQNRVGNKAYGQANVGILDIDWPNEMLTCRIIDAQNTQRFEHTVAFGELDFTSTTTQPTAVAGLSMWQRPVPGAGAAQIFFNQKISGTLSIHDATGRLVRQIAVSDLEQVRVTDLPAGQYVATLGTAQRSVAATTRLVVE
jgi:alkaline phosphatase D